MNFLSLLIVLVSMNFQWLFAQEKTTIIYVGDPMCSWCYGFAPEILEVKKHFSSYDFKIVVGGLRPEGTETMEKLGDFLRHHWEDVHKASNQPFKYDILEQKKFIYNTEPACRAVVTVRAIHPEMEMEFFKGVQHAFYAENKQTNDVNTYTDIASSLQIDTEKFKTLYLSEEIKKKTKEDFALASQMGVTGFPAVIISHKGELHLVARGYTKADQLIKNINKIIK